MEVQPSFVPVLNDSLEVVAESLFKPLNNFAAPTIMDFHLIRIIAQDSFQNGIRHDAAQQDDSITTQTPAFCVARYITPFNRQAPRLYRRDTEQDCWTSRIGHVVARSWNARTLGRYAGDTGPFGTALARHSASSTKMEKLAIAFHLTSPIQIDEEIRPDKAARAKRFF
jgi:hypothetical protein